MFRPERLVKLRKEKRLTQEELGEKVSSTKGTISNYENGHSTPPGETLVLIANTLNTTTDYLLGRTNEPHPDIINQNFDDQAEFEAFINNPEHGIFFKDYLSAPEERREEMRIIFRALMEKEKGRKPGQRQGE
ncbi:HTH-type transcriptional regulator Xre [compost metagenome]